MLLSAEVRRVRDPANFDQRRQQVGDVTRLVLERRAWLDRGGPVGNEGRGHAAAVLGAFVKLERRVRGVRPVFAHDEQDHASFRMYTTP